MSFPPGFPKARDFFEPVTLKDIVFFVLGLVAPVIWNRRQKISSWFEPNFVYVGFLKDGGRVFIAGRGWPKSDTSQWFESTPPIERYHVWKVRGRVLAFLLGIIMKSKYGV